MGLKPDCKLVTMVARFCFMKDYKTLIKAMSRLERDIHLLCIGDGPFLNENKEYAKAVGVDSRIHFLGLRKDVPNLLQASDVIVLSSKHEGFSISMLEAMSCKKPFIGSNVPGIGDLVRDVALLFEFQDDEELALRIKEVLTDRTLYCNVAEKCYSFAKQYDINIISTLGITDDDIQAIKNIDGVENAYGIQTKDSMVKIDDKESVCKVIEYNENVNTPVVIAGRQIENDNECLLDNAIVRTGTGAEKYIGKKIVLENNDKILTIMTYLLKKNLR